MALSLGSALATKVYLGATEVSQAYLGATQVYTSVPPSFLLDDYTGAAAGYSLRNLSSSWTTSDVVEVRRSSDNATSGFTATEVSDGTMLAWVGTGGTDNGFVTTWYDQSGNANDNIQATTSRQPKIVNAGAVVLENSKPAVSFDGGDWMLGTFAVGTTSTGFVVANVPQGDFFFDDSTVVNGNSLNTLTNTTVRYATSGGSGGNTVTHTVTSGTWGNQNLFSYISDAANSQMGVNGAATTGTIATQTNVSGITLASGAAGAGSNLTGTMQEVILYPSNQSANLFNIKANINTEYSIYTPEFSAEAENYFSRLNGAGDTTYTAYKQPLANYIDSLVALGGAYWDDMESAASFVGVGIQGVTVPLRDGMPTLTNNNFVAGDLNTLTGLLSDGSTKYLATGLIGTDLSQNDHSLSVYASSGAISGFLGGTYSTNFVRPIAVALVPTGTSFYSTGPLDSSSKITSTPSLVGLSRSASTEFTARTNQGNETFTRASGIPNTGGLSLYAVGGGVAKTVARIATYHAGPALNLATLEGLQATLLSEIAAI